MRATRADPSEGTCYSLPHRWTWKPASLVVDDDPGIRELTADFLSAHGYAVDTAQDGPTMRAALAAQRYALVVLDVMMPGEDGLTILRSLDRATAPPVIILSVIGEEVDRIVGLEMGADDYVAKPANPRELLARIRSVLRRNRGPRGPVVPIAPPRALMRFAGWRLDPLARQLLDSGRHRHQPVGRRIPPADDAGRPSPPGAHARFPARPFAADRMPNISIARSTSRSAGSAASSRATAARAATS